MKPCRGRLKPWILLVACLGAVAGMTPATAGTLDESVTWKETSRNHLLARPEKPAVLADKHDPGGRSYTEEAELVSTPYMEEETDGLWDETGVDWPVPEIPDIRETTPALARARILAREIALEMGATEEQAEEAVLEVPDNLDNWKSLHQLAFEEHVGKDPTDVEKWDPKAPVRRSALTPRRETKSTPNIDGTKRVLGWHPHWATMTDIENYQYSNLTTIAYFSYQVNSTNGGYDNIWAWNTSPVVEWAHSNGVKVVLTATLFGDAATHRFLTNHTARSNLINNLVNVVSNRGGDGVCIDFEGIGSWTGATTNLTAFMSNLTTRFHKDLPGSEVSIALPAVDWYANFAVSNFAKAGLDYAIIMGYDYYYSGSSTPGPVAPLMSSAQWIGASSWCSVNYSMNNYLGKGISTNRLMLGVPYYGRRWAAASTNLGAASLGSAHSSALTYGACESEAAKYGKRWDNHASVPYYVYTSNSTAYQCFYDDVTSLGLKYDLSNSKNMGGIGIWNLTQGSGKTELWSLIHDKFGAEADPPPVGADCIRSQGFDGVDAHPWGWSVVFLNNNGLATNVAMASGAEVSTNLVLAGEHALRLWGATNGAVNPAIVFDDVDISGYTNVTLTIPFAANGPDSGDDLHVSVSYDGGATWMPSVWGTQIADGFSNLKLDYNVFTSADRQPQGTPYVLAVSDNCTRIMVRIVFFNASDANNTIDSYYLDEIQLKGQAGVDVDTDGDGLPDWWEQLYFDGPTAAHPDDDPDGDGMTNWQEYIAGTDPTREDSVLALEPLVVQAGAATNLVFQWPGVEGRIYAIWRATNVMSAYTQHLNGIAATPPITSWTNPAPAPLGTYYYQLRVRWPGQP